MENHNFPESAILVKLPQGDPRISEEFKKLNETLNEKSDCDVVLDFSNVEIINSSNISNLLILRAYIEDQGRRLILCNVKTITKCIFVVAGLSECFVFIDDIEEVVKTLNTVYIK